MKKILSIIISVIIAIVSHDAIFPEKAELGDLVFCIIIAIVVSTFMDSSISSQINIRNS